MAVLTLWRGWPWPSRSGGRRPAGLGPGRRPGGRAAATLIAGSILPAASGQQAQFLAGSAGCRATTMSNEAGGHSPRNNRELDRLPFLQRLHLRFALPPTARAPGPSTTSEPDLGRPAPSSARLSVESWAHSLQPAGDAGIPAMQGSKVRWWRVAAMSKYAVFFTLKGEAIAQAMEQPSDRVTVVSKAVESAGGTLEAYYLMFGQYDGFVIVDLPDSRASSATSLAVSSTGAFEHLETHELIEAEDLN